MPNPRLTRRSFLTASAAAATLSRPVRAATSTRPDHLIVAIADGGWDTAYAIDPKMDSPHVEGPESGDDPDDVEYVMGFHQNQVLQCNDLRRPTVRTFYEKWGDRMAVINGQFVGSITHESCQVRVFTGTADPSAPDFGTIFGAEYGKDLPLGTIDFSALSFPGPLSATTGRVGHRNQLRALLDPEAFLQPPPGADFDLPLYRLGSSERDAVRAYMESRADRMRQLVGDGGANDRHLDSFMESVDRRDRLIDFGPEFVGDLVIGKEPTLKQQTELAVDLLTKGLCRSVILRDSGDWDTHKKVLDQHDLHYKFFAAMDQMLDNLVENDMLDRTLVVICSEMGRTPKVNDSGGKDHWGHTTQLLVGGGVNGGLRMGGTDEYGEGLWVDYGTGDPYAKGERIKYDNFVASILAHMDVDPEKWLPGITPFSAWSNFR